MGFFKLFFRKLHLKIQATIIRAVTNALYLGDWLFKGHRRDHDLIGHKVSRHYEIKASKTGRSIRIRAWDPPNAKAGRPVHINFHGSGYILHWFGVEAGFLDHLSRTLGITVLDVEYAKAPERPFPAAFDEVHDVIQHVVSQPELYDLSNLTIGGFSAGGGLAFSAALFAPEESRRHIKAVVGVYPWLDVAERPLLRAPTKPGASGIPLTPDLLATFAASYTADSPDPASLQKDPRVSPAFATDSQLENYPSKVLVIVPERDSLTPRTVEYAHRIRDTGKKTVWLREIFDVGHGWIDSSRSGFEGWEGERKKEAFDYAVRFFTEAVYTS